MAGSTTDLELDPDLAYWLEMAEARAYQDIYAAVAAAPANLAPYRLSCGLRRPGLQRRDRDAVKVTLLLARRFGYMPVSLVAQVH